MNKHIMIPFWALRVAIRHPGKVFATQGGVAYLRPHIILVREST